MFVWELKRQRNHVLFHVALYSGMLLLTALFVMLLDDKGYIARKITELLRPLPEMVTSCFIFLKSKEMTPAMKGNLLLLLFMFLPVLYYAMTLPVKAFEKEETEGTIFYTLNGKVTRAEIFLYKSLVSGLYWLFSVLAWFLVSLVLLFSGSSGEGRIQLFGQLVSVWGSMLAAGWFLMAAGTLYVSLKRRLACGEDFCFYMLFVLTALRLVPFILSFVSSVLFQFGHGVQTLTEMIRRIDAAVQWIPIFWCNPIRTYVHFISLPQVLIYLSGFAAMYAGAYFIYQRREFE